MTHFVDKSTYFASKRQPSAVSYLRSSLRSCHEKVDAAFSGFNLGDKKDYGRFLIAHARATLGAEATLTDCSDLPYWRPRSQLLLRDLAALGLNAPLALALHLPEGPAARWGALYVLEGSRLGGSVLQRRTASHFPKMFLSALHVGGEWRALLIKMKDRAAADKDWIAGVEDGARACFDLYLRAANSRGNSDSLQLSIKKDSAYPAVAT